MKIGMISQLRFARNISILAQLNERDVNQIPQSN